MENGIDKSAPLDKSSSSMEDAVKHEDVNDVVLGYGFERNEKTEKDILEEDNPNVYHKMNFRLFLILTAMSFLWVGSQIPLYLFGSILPLIYSEVGDAGRYVWMVIGYLIPCACLCPFVGALSDLFGRRAVGATGQVLLIIGPVVTSTAKTMNVAIGGQVISGLGAGLNELTALAATGEIVPIKKRGAYIGAIVFSILPFCPSALWAQLIARDANWRYVGILVGVWNFVGLILLLAFYKDPARVRRPAKEILGEVDYIGGILSISGVLCFMMGMQWGATQYTWGSVHVLVPFIIGIVLIIAFFVWEAMFAPHPMAPPKLFSKSKRTMVLTLIITFFSGANFFVLLLFWPTEVYNVYGANPVLVGLRTLPIGFGIIGGAAIGLVSISVLKGRTTILMIFSTALMTAGTGAMAVATTQNINTVYGLITIASIGVGLVIIPCSIICQICCPSEYIGTITAITLSIRYIGGAIGFTAYYNIFYHKFEGYAAEIIAPGIEKSFISFNKKAIITLIDLASEARYQDLHEYIAESPLVLSKATAYHNVISYTQEAFALAYRWPYWMSIAFGGVCLIASLGLKDIREFL